MINLNNERQYFYVIGDHLSDSGITSIYDNKLSYIVFLEAVCPIQKQ